MPRACSPPAQIAASTTPALPRTRSVSGATDPGSISSVVFHPRGVIKSASRANASLLTARGEQLQRRHIPAQPVIQRRLGPVRSHGGKPGRNPGRQRHLGAGQPAISADLSQHWGQSRDPRIQRVAILARCGRLPIAGHHLRQPGALVFTDLAQNPGPGPLTQFPVNLTRHHQTRLRRFTHQWHTSGHCRTAQRGDSW